MNDFKIVKKIIADTISSSLEGSSFLIYIIGFPSKVLFLLLIFLTCISYIGLFTLQLLYFCFSISFEMVSL